MAHDHANLSTVAVAGGMLLVSVDADDERNELYDEGSGRCLQLPLAMQRRLSFGAHGSSGYSCNKQNADRRVATSHQLTVNSTWHCSCPPRTPRP